MYEISYYDLESDTVITKSSPTFEYAKWDEILLSFYNSVLKSAFITLKCRLRVSLLKIKNKLQKCSDSTESRGLFSELLKLTNIYEKQIPIFLFGTSHQWLNNLHLFFTFLRSNTKGFKLQVMRNSKKKIVSFILNECILKDISNFVTETTDIDLNNIVNDSNIDPYSTSEYEKLENKVHDEYENSRYNLLNTILNEISNYNTSLCPSTSYNIHTTSNTDFTKKLMTLVCHLNRFILEHYLVFDLIFNEFNTISALGFAIGVQESTTENPTSIGLFRQPIATLALLNNFIFGGLVIRSKSYFENGDPICPTLGHMNAIESVHTYDIKSMYPSTILENDLACGKLNHYILQTENNLGKILTK